MQRLDVDVCNAVAVGEHERSSGSSQRRQTLEASSGLGKKPRIDQVYCPIGLVAGVNGCFPGPQVDGDVVVQGVEIQKVVLDHFGLVARAITNSSIPYAHRCS